MKYPVLHICLIFLLTSCVSDRSWYTKGERFRVSSKAKSYFTPSDSKTSYPIDSTLYTKLLDNGSSEFCAMMAAFTMSEVKLERLLPNRCHSQMFYFQNCSAFILKDTVNIVFKTQNPRRSMASNKIMKVRLLGNEHHTEIIHWGAEKQVITQTDGSTNIRNAPTSEIINTRLKLNKNFYQFGDTIIGEIKVVSVQYKGKRKTKVKEEASGKFRAIVGGFDIECDISESLAHSWLR